MDAAWAKDIIWWQLYPLGFTGAPIRQAHDECSRLPRIINWLDYVVDLGLSGILLGPIFASETHGYDSVDMMQIDPRLGTLEDFDQLVAACKDRGLRILLDGVFNHFGAEHPWVKSALAEGPNGPYADFFRLDWSDPQNPKTHTFEGHASLVTLNHDDPRVRDYVAQIMEVWLGRGIDGWRLDAAYSVPDHFWASVLPRVRRKYPEAWFLGEVIHGDYAEIAEASTINSLTQYELWKAIWSSLNDRNYWELDAALERNNAFLQAEVPNTFIGNHDVTRIASKVGAEGAVLALVVLMTVGGIPSVYAGDEHAYAGVKEERVGGDDDIRPLMPEHPEQLSHLGADTHALYQELISLRRRHPWLPTAMTEKVHLTNEAYTYLTRGGGQGQVLRVSLDVAHGHYAKVEDSSGRALFEYRSGSVVADPELADQHRKQPSGQGGDQPDDQGGTDPGAQVPNP